ncbi:glycosyltransferase family 2 protein [Chloroflexi bacterium TSY]|nr:glycosyltransferase family 2 protein [Chloroflexi bacterium TSY]
MFCSTVIPTVGRSTLSRAVHSVLTQELPAEFEVIVVNDSGTPLPEADWQQSSRVRVLDTCRRERSVARNTGAAVAKGKFLHFLDDDDCLLPGALAHFWDLVHRKNGNWVLGNSQLQDRQGQYISELRHKMEGNCFIQVMAGEWMPMGAWAIESSLLFTIGGFNSMIAGPEDVDICRRLALYTDLISSSQAVACITMGEEGSTTNRARAQQESHWAREQILAEPGVFSRMNASADTSYWYGRMVRVYLTSIMWNLRHKNLLTAASRALWGILAFAAAGSHIIASDFWYAITKAYKSPSFGPRAVPYSPQPEKLSHMPLTVNHE